MKKDPIIDALVVLTSSVEEIESNHDEISIGQWYWIKWKTTDKEGNAEQYYDYDHEKFMPMPERELVCVMKLGSNYAEVKSPRRISSRIHLDKFNLELEPNPQAFFDKEISIKRAEIASTMGEINSLVASVGIGRQIAEGSNAIATLDENVSAESCKAELAKVKESLPELFSKMESILAQNGIDQKEPSGSPQYLPTSFHVDELNSDDSIIFIDVGGVGTVVIRNLPMKICVDIYPLQVAEEPVRSMEALHKELMAPEDEDELLPKLSGEVSDVLEEYEK